MNMTIREFTALTRKDVAAAKSHLDAGRKVEATGKDISLLWESIASADLTGGCKGRLQSHTREMFKTGHTLYPAAFLKDIAARVELNDDEAAPGGEAVTFAEVTITVGLVAAAIGAVGLGIVIGNLAEDYFNDDDDDDEGDREGGTTTVTASTNGDGDVTVTIE